MTENNNDPFNRSIFAGFTNLGAPVDGECMVSNYFGPKDVHTDGGDFIPGTQIIKHYGEQDLNEVVVNEPFQLRDEELFDKDAYTGQSYTGADQYKVNRPHFPAYEDWVRSLNEGEPATYQDYDNFLGGFFKKVGHAIGGAAKSVGHAAGWAAGEAEHAHKAVGNAIGKVAKGAVKDEGKLLKTVGHGISWTAKEGVHLHNVAGAETQKIVKAVAPYWKYVAEAAIVAGAVVAEIATAGAATPFVLAAVGGLMGAVNSIPGGTGPEPVIPFGLGGGDGPGDPDPDAEQDDELADDDGANAYDPDQVDDEQDPNALDDIQDANYLPQPETFQLQPKPNYTKYIIIGVILILVYWFLKKK